MIYVVLAGAVIAGAIVGYVRFVRWQMSRTIATRYNSVVARFLPENTVVTFWRTIYLKDARQQLTGPKLAHELYHINRQWARWPLTFLFRYLIESALRGYDKNKYEQEARRAAGQGER